MAIRSKKDGQVIQQPEDVHEMTERCSKMAKRQPNDGNNGQKLSGEGQKMKTCR